MPKLRASSGLIEKTSTKDLNVISGVRGSGGAMAGHFTLCRWREFLARSSVGGGSREED